MDSFKQLAIECKNIGRIYRSRNLLGKTQNTVALADLTFEIPRGTVFGLLGPNGAGKTTTIRILSTLLTPTTGSAKVLGFDVLKQSDQVRKNIGFILGGDRGLYARLTGKENLRYFGAINHMNPRDANRRADYLLQLVDLAGQGDTPVERYSRGMKQRLHIARGLMTDPNVLFMDEPTIGLDPKSAQELRQYIPEMVSQGKTVLLTTHYMFEADILCDTIGVINKGSLVALGTPTEIKQRFGKTRIIEVITKRMTAGITEQLSSVDGVERIDVGEDGPFQKVTVQARVGVELRNQVSAIIGSPNIEYMSLRDPTLEEAYLSILR